MDFLTQLLLCASLLPFSAAILDFSPCAFPFVYKNKTYSTCTKEGSSLDRLWCATTGSYDKDYRWKRCYEKEHGGNSHGKPCVFPFVYRERKFYTCTDESTRPRMFWCATTSNFDVDKKWSYCADIRNSTIFCVPVSHKFTILDTKETNMEELEELGKLDDKEEETFKGGVRKEFNQDALVKYPELTAQMIPIASEFQVACKKLTDVQETSYGEFEQEGDQDMIV